MCDCFDGGYGILLRFKSPDEAYAEWLARSS
jgi:hypothetical protein